MKLLTTLPYDEVDFVWVTNHYDLHLNGLCKHNGKWCTFETDVDYEWDGSSDDKSTCNIYQLTLKEKIQWWFRKRKFELMVGYHCSYDEKNRHKTRFYYRKPQWLYKFLFNLFYKLKTKTK